MLTHIEHPEDLMLKYGSFGFHVAMGHLKEFASILRGKQSYAKLSLKIDGSPAIVFGTCPDTGKFFVSTKRFWNQKRILCYSIDDIYKHWPSPAHDDIRQKLTLAFLHLPKVVCGNYIYQGDFLFSTTDGTFQPCLIKYKATGNERMKMMEAKMGIAIHSSWFVTEVGELRSKQRILCEQHPDVYMMDLEMDSFCVHDIDDSYLRGAELSFAAVDVEGLARFGELPLRYVNRCIREKLPVGDMAVISDVFPTHSQFQVASLYSLFASHNCMMEYKNRLIEALDSEDKNPWLTHELNGVPCGPEGYVMTYHNIQSKFVNRRVYSQAILEKIKG